MKRALAGGLAILALLIVAIPGRAGAADMPVKARPPMPVAAPKWSGLYVGIVGGYAWGQGHFIGTGTGVGRNNEVSMPGGMFGGRIGYDYTLGSNVVIGGIADLSWADLNGQTCVATFACNPAEDAFALGKMKWFSTVRGRVGIATPNALLYATGGLALAGLQGSITNLTAPGDPTLTASHTHVGWTVGGGIEYRLWRHVTVGVEYLYVDLGQEHYDFSNSLPGVPIVLGADGTLTASVFRGSLNYRFDCPNC
jgi:outer membrane immunogenic protein